MSDDYYLKMRRYDGSESVVLRGTKANMEARAAQANEDTQSTQYYVEEYSEERMMADWVKLTQIVNDLSETFKKGPHNAAF